MTPPLKELAKVLHRTTVNSTLLCLDWNRNADSQILAKSAQSDLDPEKKVRTVARMIVNWIDLDTDLLPINNRSTAPSKSK